MTCSPEVLKGAPLFSLLDDETAVLAAQVELKTFQVRVTRNPNDLIEAEATTGERVADHVARFGGSWTFIIAFGSVHRTAKLWKSFVFRRRPVTATFAEALRIAADLGAVPSPIAICASHIIMDDVIFPRLCGA
jgi:hypothetical protein